METVELIKQQLSSDPIVLYMKGTPEQPQCGFSARVCQILEGCGAEFKAINILANSELREELKIFSNWPTYPQLYINGELIGGCDIIMELYQSGELQTMLKNQSAAI